MCAGLAAAVSWSGAGCAAERDAPRVLATTTVVADLVRQVAGDRVSLDCLMGPGIDPHGYKATPRDADRLARADLVVASGLHLEGKLGELLEKLATRTHVVAVAEALPRDRLLEVAPGLYDPHVWFDARLWSMCAPAVAEALSKVDPSGAAVYADRARSHAARLERLDEEVRGRIATIPAERRVLVTAHDAFRYFGRAYAIEVVGVQGTSTESEAGLADINRLVDLVVTRKIPAVFVETSVSDRNVQALQEGARARGQPVSLGGRLYSDSLGGAGSGAETLESVLRTNAETIVAELVGEQ
ncbi:MAG: zinc ABC transporter substrate-binding protein [Planctomycetia bacterium]